MCSTCCYPWYSLFISLFLFNLKLSLYFLLPVSFLQVWFLFHLSYNLSFSSPPLAHRLGFITCCFTFLSLAALDLFFIYLLSYSLYISSLSLPCTLLVAAQLALDVSFSFHWSSSISSSPYVSSFLFPLSSSAFCPTSPIACHFLPFPAFLFPSYSEFNFSVFILSSI